MALDCNHLAASSVPDQDCFLFANSKKKTSNNQIIVIEITENITVFDNHAATTILLSFNLFSFFLFSFILTLAFDKYFDCKYLMARSNWQGKTAKLVLTLNQEENKGAV